MHHNNWCGSIHLHNITWEIESDGFFRMLVARLVFAIVSVGNISRNLCMCSSPLLTFRMIAALKSWQMAYIVLRHCLTATTMSISVVSLSSLRLLMAPIVQCVHSEDGYIEETYTNISYDDILIIKFVSRNK